MNNKVTMFAALTLAMSGSAVFAQSDHYQIKLLTGDAIETMIPFIAQQRIELFREYPYLYDGVMQEELAYLNWFSALPSCALAVAYCDEKPVAFLSGAGVVEFDEHFQGSKDLFKKAGLQPEQYYYFSECIVLPEHRGHQLSDKLNELLEMHAKELGYSAGCFVTESHDEHPLKPDDYRSMEVHWQRLGYVKSAVSINFSWPTRQIDGTTQRQEHVLVYWFKNFVTNNLE